VRGSIDDWLRFFRNVAQYRSILKCREGQNVESLGAQVERWYHQLQQQAPFREHVMIPFAELRGRLDY
jgi:hypothetical protein